MYLSKNKKSGIWYIYYKKENGKKTRLSTKSTIKSEAYKVLTNFKKEVKLRESRTDISLDEVAQKYFKVVSITHTESSYLMTQKMINYFLDYAGKETLVSKVDKSIAEGFILGTYEHAKWHAALQLRHLKAFFNRAIGWGYVEKNPFKGIKLSIPENHPAFINVAELNSIVSKETDFTLKQIYKFAFYTGCRLSEILNLEWDDVNLASKEIRVRNKNGYTTKSKRERVIPMSNIVYELLLDLQNETTGYIFNRNGGGWKGMFVSKRFKKAVREAKLNDEIHFHSLRHSFCSNLIGKGASIYVIKSLAGHQSIVTTQRYSHLRKENLQQAIELLN